jgi:HAE1 family hydrophobic/amphiphilic exporter-1
MRLIDWFVHNPVKIVVGVLLTCLFGIVAAIRMPMQLTPEVSTPTLTIETRWPGASPHDVEQEIIIEQEEQLKSVEGITKMTSEAMDSSGKITLEFRVGENMEEALLKVNSRLQQVPEYPEDADEPVISTANAADRPIAWFILSARRPSNEQLAEYAQKYPELTEQLNSIRDSHNEGLAMLRLRRLAAEHPEIEPLLPPKDLDVNKLRRFAEDEIEARFERVSGVSQSNVFGGLEEELQVVVDPQKLAVRGVTITDVRNVLRGQNEDTSAGDFWEGKRRWVVRTLGQFRNEEQVASQLLTVVNGAPVYVRDIGEVRLGFKKPDGLVRRFGEASIALSCLRETGANVLDVMDGLREARQEIDEEVLASRNLQLTQVYDETEYINSSIGMVWDNIFVGGALTIAVLMCFLHLGVRTMIAIPLLMGAAIATVYVSPWFMLPLLVIVTVTGIWFARAAYVVVVSIPVSIIGTFLIMSMLGRSLNVISLAGLAFAVGMLVDNFIVVLENIERHYRELHKPPFQAAVDGASEVWGAIVAASLTNVAVFLPVVFVEQEAGQLFRDIALSASAAVGISMLVAITLVPTAAARLFAAKEGEPQPEGSAHQGNGRPIVAGRPGWMQRFASGVGRIFAWPMQKLGTGFVQSVVLTNEIIQKSTLLRLAVVALLVAGAGLVSYVFWPPVEYLPVGNRNLVFGMVLPPPGYNLDELMEMGVTVETELQPYWDLDPESAEAAALDHPPIGDFFFVARGRQVFLGLRAHDPTRAGELVPLVMKVRDKLPGTFVVAFQSSIFEQSLEGGRTIEIEITGPELERMVALGGQVMGQVGPALMPDAPPEVRAMSVQARPVPSLDLSSPELHIEPKLVQAAEMGVSSSDLGYAANALIDGAYAGDYYLGGDKIDLSIVGIESYAERTQDISALPVATPWGQLIPLGALADVTIASGPEQINHRERVRAITIEVTPPPEIPLEHALTAIEDKIVQPLRESGQLEGGYRIGLAGTADKLTTVRETFVGKWTGWNGESILSVLTSQACLVIIIAYLLMAALFESWLYPFVIILSVPLGAVGGVLGLNLLNMYLVAHGIVPQQLDVLTMLGFVILVGTVVNNPILIVHQALNHIRDDGMTQRAAVLESVRTRIKPIFMSTITAVLGLIPLVLFPGAGSELYRGLGAVFLGGLLISTIFTLILVPTLFSLTMDVKEGTWDRLFRRKEKSSTPIQRTRQREETPRPEPAAAGK